MGWRGLIILAWIDLENQTISSINQGVSSGFDLECSVRVNHVKGKCAIFLGPSHELACVASYKRLMGLECGHMHVDITTNQLHDPLGTSQANVPSSRVRLTP